MPSQRGRYSVTKPAVASPPKRKPRSHNITFLCILAAESAAATPFSTKSYPIDAISLASVSERHAPKRMRPPFPAAAVAQPPIVGAAAKAAANGPDARLYANPPAFISARPPEPKPENKPHIESCVARLLKNMI